MSPEFEMNLKRELEHDAQRRAELLGVGRLHPDSARLMGRIWIFHVVRAVKWMGGGANNMRWVVVENIYADNSESCEFQSITRDVSIAEHRRGEVSLVLMDDVACHHIMASKTEDSKISHFDIMERAASMVAKWYDAKTATTPEWSGVIDISRLGKGSDE